MTDVGHNYGTALYTLAREEGLSEVILQQMTVLCSCFAQEPDFLRLIGSPTLPKAERRKILEDCFQGKTETYLLNFLKILTEKGYIRHFPDCVKIYQALYDDDNGILRVTAVTAIPMTQAQEAALTAKLQAITGKRIALVEKPDPAILGGMRLDYDGKRVDGTLAHGLERMRRLLERTVL